MKEWGAIKGTIVKTVDVPIGGEMFSPLQTGEIILKNGAELLAVNGVDNRSQLGGFQNRFDAHNGFEILRKATI